MLQIHDNNRYFTKNVGQHHGDPKLPVLENLQLRPGYLQVPDVCQLFIDSWNALVAWGEHAYHYRNEDEKDDYVIHNDLLRMLSKQNAALMYKTAA